MRAAIDRVRIEQRPLAIAKGKPSHNVHDLQIAATAVAHGHAVLTGNRDDFRKIPGLVVECRSVG